MDKNELAKKIAELQRAIEATRNQRLHSYAAPKNVKEDEEKSVQDRLDGQKPKHRTLLLALIFGLTIASFVLLMFIVIFQMLWQIRHPGYIGVSDDVIKVLAVGVFAELVGVVAIIAKLVWKDK